MRILPLLGENRALPHSDSKRPQAARYLKLVAGGRTFVRDDQPVDARLELDDLPTTLSSSRVEGTRVTRTRPVRWNPAKRTSNGSAGSTAMPDSAGSPGTGAGATVSESSRTTVSNQALSGEPGSA